MYPAKPSGGTPGELVALFRFPKRTLSRDDSGWLGDLYPTDAHKNETHTVEGRARYAGKNFIGAQVIALNQESPDTDVVFFPAAAPTDMIIKGIDNVAAFSEEDGRFKLPGLKPGAHSFIVQDGDTFLTFSLDNVNQFLSTFASANIFPNQFWFDPDCADEPITDSGNVAALLASVPVLGLSAGKRTCNLEVEAHIGGSRCGGGPGINKGKCSGGSCVFISGESQTPTGTFLVWILSLILLFAARIRVRARARS